MSKEPREYALAELVENPGLGLALEHDGIDPRSIELLLEETRARRRRLPLRPDYPFSGWGA